ncbi:MAG: SLC13 family permease [Aggregatilineales bacterium]
MEITTDMWIVLAILAVAILLFVTDWLRVDVVALGVVIALMLTEILTPTEAIAGFSSSAVLTIAALFIVGGAVLQTGLAGVIGQRILKIAGTDEIRLTAVIMIAVALLSGVMSDTGTVAVLLPAIIGLASSAKISPSKLLIPLSFGSLLGGAMTLIGTPPNIIVSSLLREENTRLISESLEPVYTPFEFFSFAPIGILMLICGILFMITIGRRILPDYKSESDSEEYESLEELANRYELNRKVAYVRVRSKSPLKDITLSASKLGHEYNLTVMEIERPIAAQSVASFGNQKILIEKTYPEHIFPTATTVIKQDDILVIQGEEEDLQRAVQDKVLEIQENRDYNNDEGFMNRVRGIAEVLLPPRSSLLGKSLSDTRFAQTFNLNVLEIRRPGNIERLDLQNEKLEFGDILLVQGMWDDIMTLKSRKQDFVVMGQPEAMVAAIRTRKAPIAAMILLALLAILILDAIPLVTAALLGAFVMVLTGCLSMDEAYRAIDWKSIVLIAGMLPMATALEKVGLVDEITFQVTSGLGSGGPYVMLGGLFLLTSLLTQVLSNTATAVLVAPIALASAQQLDVQPYAFLMAVAIAASMAFASPVASPVNTLVLGAGNYKFVDYIKIGIPMIVIMFIITMIAVPIVFPF